MADQKIENLLNLALNATRREREKSLELDVGYSRDDKEWELIVKYSGTLNELREIGIQVVELSNEFAILTVPESLVERLADFPQIEYVEKPKRLFFQAANGRRVSCVPPVQNPPFSLFGSGVLVAIIDSGIDYTNPDFRNDDGTTRIRNLWDQTIMGNPPEGYLIGTEFTREQIDEAADSADAYANCAERGCIRSWDISSRNCSWKWKRKQRENLSGSCDTE